MAAGGSLKLNAVLKAVAREYGRDVTGAVMEDVERIPTGIFALDLALGGGFPAGRVSVIYGEEAGMKTSVALKLLAQAQRKWPKLTPVFVDVEGHFDGRWAKRLGVDITRLALLRPGTAEQVADVVEKVLMAEDVSVVVVDSLAAMTTTRELSKSTEDALVGSPALLINKLYRRSGYAINEARKHGRNPTLICINQVRYKIGVLMGDPETQPGGPSFKFASSMTVRLRGRDETGGQPKSKSGLAPFREVSVIVKKYKVPIIQRQTKFMVALRDQPKLGLVVGQSFDVPILLRLLKALGFLTKTEGRYVISIPGHKKRWSVTKLDDLKKKLVESEALRMEVAAALTEYAVQNGIDVDPADDD